MSRKYKRAKDRFEEAALKNNITYLLWYDYFKNICINRFEWTGLPETVDERFLELTLFEKGFALFFKDPVVDIFVALTTMISGEWDIYNIPRFREAYATNDYHCERDNGNSVLIFNNYLHTSDVLTCEFYALKLYQLDRTIDTNVNGQKTPLLIRSTEAQRLTLTNLYMQYDGNYPVIFGDKQLEPDSIQAIQTQSPYVSDKLMVLKHQYINEFLTHFGIENSNEEKKERLVESEVASNYGIVEASRHIALNSRKQACKQINDMFGLNLDVNYRSMVDTKLNRAFRNFPDTEEPERDNTEPQKEGEE